MYKMTRIIAVNALLYLLIVNDLQLVVTILYY